MKTAKIFERSGSQTVRPPWAFRFPASEVLIDKHGEEMVLRPVTHTQFAFFAGIARHLAENFPEKKDFLEPLRRPANHKHGIPKFWATFAQCSIRALSFT